MSLEERIAALLTERSGRSVTVVTLEPLFGGACQEHLRVVVRGLDEAQVSAEQTLVLRTDAPTSLPGSLSRRHEFPVIRAAVAAGVRTPAVHWLVEDLLGPGRSSYFMDWVPGETIARRVLAAPELEQARSTLLDELAAQLARIHSVRPDEVADPALRQALGDSGGDDVEQALAGHRRALDGLPDTHLAIELALRFLRENRPPRQAPTLCHGDYRTGNFAVTEAGLCAVLDWEFAHWGDPMDDLGWACVRDWRFGQIHAPAFGLGSRQRLFEAYQAASGQSVDPQRVRYWELMGNVRWAIAALHQGQRYRQALERGEDGLDLELIAIGRRALELEYEIVRMLDTWSDSGG